MQNIATLLLLLFLLLHYHLFAPALLLLHLSPGSTLLPREERGERRLSNKG